MFDDYEVPVVSNLEQDKHCLAFWETYDTYTILDNISGKAEPELKERITTLKTELRFVEECTFSVSKTCAKHKQPLVQVLQKLDPKQLENIKGNYSNCTEVRCYLGNTSALTDQSVYHLGNGTTNYSTEGRDAETQLNYDYLQQNRSILSNNTASNQETSHTERKRFCLIIAAISVALLAVGLVYCILKKTKCCELHAKNHNRVRWKNTHSPNTVVYCVTANA
ncbi:unnamed protein product [Staurois parvus]|uniref:Uncharacterized protein n=1 Tax=Staurois parvus TaxID=386267 RepID=A0ABN9ES75_9NEOB|nr:unnamed protein product [Staurois parvus]